MSSKIKNLSVSITAFCFILIGVACSDAEVLPVLGADTYSLQPTPEMAVVVPKIEAEQVIKSLGNYQSNSSSGTPLGSSTSGIWVTGHASISLDPDLVILNIGVEAIGETVARARDRASKAMSAVLKSVKSNGLTDSDVQTISFNIYPRYEYPEVNLGGTLTRKQTLVGYTVNNTVGVKIRDLEKVGEIIDDAVNAAGDSIRINRINFTIEDTSPFMDDLRDRAVRNAIDKAEHFATLMGVSVGGVIYISEVGSGIPMIQDMAGSEMFALAKAAAPPTSINAGQLEIGLDVQIIFEIR